MTEYGTGTLPYSGDNRDVVRNFYTLNHSLSSTTKAYGTRVVLNQHTGVSESSQKEWVR